MKVYAVFVWNHDDRELVAVFSSKEAAKEYQTYLDVENTPVEFELDSVKPPDWWDTMKKSYTCWAHKLSEQSPGVWVYPRFIVGQVGLSVCEDTWSECGLQFSRINCEISSPGKYEMGPDAYNKPEFLSRTERLRVYIIANNEEDAISKASELFTEWLHENQHTFQK